MNRELVRYGFDELRHHGIKGMRWGIRRYQNKDGTLTAYGKKRYNKEMAKLREEAKVMKNKQATKAKMDRLAAKRKEVEDMKRDLEPARKSKKSADSGDAVEPKKKTIKDMSDDELRAAVTRMQLEQQYASMSPQKASIGKKYAMKALNDIVVPSITNTARQAAEKQLKKAFRLEKEDPLATLRKENEQRGVQKTKIELDNFFKKNSENSELQAEVDTLELLKKKAKAQDFLNERIKDDEDEGD